MSKASINYLFPPEKINGLPTWKFVLHFKAPVMFRKGKTQKAISALKTAEWKIIEFSCALEELKCMDGTLSIPVEISEERRARPDSLADYESDVWKIMGNVLEFGFGDLYYEAVDWNEEEEDKQ